LQIPSIKKTVININHFKSSISKEAIVKYALEVEKVPIIHISAHGSAESFELTDGTIFQWYELRDYLVPINKIFNGYLILCMSTCSGGNFFEMAFTGEDLPFYNLIGCMCEIEWRDTLIGFLTFYHLLHKGFSIEDAVNNMKKASGNENFKHFYGMDLQKDYREKIIDILEKFKKLSS